MRRSIEVCLVVVGLAVAGVARAEDKRINAVIGDASWTAAFGESPADTADEVTRIRTHLTYVLARLRTRDGSELSPMQRMRRAAALSVLERYIARGVFPRRTADPYPGRRPRFIDDRGVYCAVGQLLADSGASALARSIDAAHEFAYVPDITTPGLAAWAGAHGFALDELAMIQPTYGSPPTAKDTREAIEAAKARIVLACAARYPALVQLVVSVAGDKRGAATVTTRSEAPFARCFVELASRIEGGGGAYRGSPRVYAFDMKLDLPSPQSLFERTIDQVDPSRECLPRPGAIPRAATIEATVDIEGLAVHVTTTPANAEVARCFEDTLRRYLHAYGAGTWELGAHRERAIAPRMTSRALERELRGFARAYATDCAPERDPPKQITVSAAARADDAAFTITAGIADAAFAACISAKLRSALRERFSVYRPVEGGTTARYFRIDAAVRATVTVDVESRAARDEALRRARERTKKLQEEVDRYRWGM